MPVVTEQQLTGALAEADHVVRHPPGQHGNTAFLRRQALYDHQTGRGLYNIGRGTTVVQDALLDALRSGQIGAAWLDVTEPEPLQTNIRCERSRIVLSRRTSQAAIRARPGLWSVIFLNTLTGSFVENPCWTVSCSSVSQKSRPNPRFHKRGNRIALGIDEAMPSTCYRRAGDIAPYPIPRTARRAVPTYFFFVFLAASSSRAA